MKKILIEAGVVSALQILQPLERIPKIGGFAPEIELAVGIGSYAGFAFKKKKIPFVRPVCEAFIVSGLVKTIKKYIPMVKK